MLEWEEGYPSFACEESSLSELASARTWRVRKRIGLQSMFEDQFSGRKKPRNHAQLQTLLVLLTLGLCDEGLSQSSDFGFGLPFGSWGKTATKKGVPKKAHP